MQSPYQSHFGLTREPFNVTPDPEFLFLSKSHQEALAQLIYGIKARKGFVVLTGEVGTGKTTLLHALLHELDGEVQTALVFHIVESPADLLRYLCGELGLTDPRENKKEVGDYLPTLNDLLLKTYRDGGNVSLIIDEAQNLSSEVLETVRLLSNFETSREKLIQILMVGQPELSQRLDTPELRQLKQRVVLRHELKPLSFSDCRDYIAARIKTSGGSPSIFSLSAMETIFFYSKGTPRLVNILCDNGLLSAYASGKTIVDDTIIREVAGDLCLAGSSGNGGNPVFPNEQVINYPVNERLTEFTPIVPVKRQRKWPMAIVFLIALVSLAGGIKYWTDHPGDFPMIRLEFLRGFVEKLREVFNV